MTGKELKELRNRLGLSVTQASRQVEVSTRSWQRWESGRQNIPDGAEKLFRVINKVKDDGAIDQRERATDDVKTNHTKQEKARQDLVEAMASMDDVIAEVQEKFAKFRVATNGKPPSKKKRK